MENSHLQTGRRSFLKAASTTALGTWSLGQAGGLLADPTPLGFPASMLKASHDELDIPLYVLAGRLPLDASGHGFVVSALPYEDGSPITNGDGMIYRFDFGVGASGVQLKSRIAKTPCYYADKASQGTPLAFRNTGVVRRSDKLGIRNQLNTAFTCMGERMLVTFDGGRPYEIDLETLELSTPVGRLNEWVSVVPAAASSLLKLVFEPNLSGAHPYYDEHTNELFLANYQPIVPFLPAKAFLLRWDGAGDLQQFRITVDGTDVQIKQSMHQIAATRDYIILMDTAFRIEIAQILLPQLTQAELWDTTVYIIRRSDLVNGRGEVAAIKTTIPREIAHFVADYDDSGGQIILHLTHGAAWASSEWLRSNDKEAHSGRKIRRDLQGMLVGAADMTPVARYALDAESGEIREAALLYDKDWTWSVNLYTHRGASAAPQFEHIYWTSIGFHPELLSKRIYDMEKAYKYRHVPVQDLPFATGRQASLFRVNARQLHKADADGYIFAPGRVASSPTFIPAQGRSGPTDGYIMVTVVSEDRSTSRSSGDEIWLFDARNLAQGPICRLGHPLLNFGYSLHTAWMPKVERRAASYRIAPRSDYAKALKNQSREVIELFEKSVFPYFDKA